LASYFLKRKSHQIEVIYLLCELKTRRIAYRLLSHRRGEQSFAKLARESMAKVQKQKQGDSLGPVELGTLHPNQSSYSTPVKSGS